MASSDIDRPPPINEEASFATQVDETTNIYEGSSVGTSGSRSGIETKRVNNNGDELQTVRMSSMVSNLASRFNDFILPSNKKYGLEKHVHYSKLSTVNFCFATNLNKSIKPKSYIKTIRCKWLFKIKYKSSSEIERYKARLVTKGFSQREDVNNAFLYGDLHEDVYMDLPPGYYDKSETKVYKLVKSLYRLKQALGQWNEKLTRVLKENGFEQILRYLKMSPGAGIQFYHGNSPGLHALLDAEWAKCLASRKSVSGFYVYFCRNLISWKSKKQATISRSSAEAEYRCIASTTCEIIWLTHLLKDQSVEGLLLVPLYCDSTFAIQIAANLVFLGDAVVVRLQQEVLQLPRQCT
ncbi:ribonuclease H-like domain-containing protein [Tanacetum coccineum]